MARTRSTRWRRRLGILFLASAALMLVLGQTYLSSELHGAQFILYWSACMALVLLALGTALLDAWLVRLRAAREQAELLHEVLDPARTATDPPSARGGLDHELLDRS